MPHRHKKDNETPPEEGPDKEHIIEESAFESAPTHPKQVTITDEELRNLQKELSEYKDKYLRALAESDNARKRMQKERQELVKYAVEGVISDFLHPLDNLENALKFAQDMSDEVKNWAFGFQMILTQFKDILTENGVTSIDSLGTIFDPHLHEAVEVVETSNKPAGTIIEEFVRGYKVGDRTIRPARVKVAKELPKDNGSSENEIKIKKEQTDKC
ncbi:MAG: nucleotide exchange factor GrpE [Parachlamydiaceae bacterium]|nr:nucleotide exchange factor GrpE [Parachlamydiaceae bacterium]